MCPFTRAQRRRSVLHAQQRRSVSRHTAKKCFTQMCSPEGACSYLRQATCMSRDLSASWPFYLSTPSHVIHIMTHAIDLISVHVWRAIPAHTAAFMGHFFARKTALVVRCRRQRKAPLRGGAEKCYNFQIWVYLVNCLLRGLSNCVHHFCPFCVGVTILGPRRPVAPPRQRRCRA